MKLKHILHYLLWEDLNFSTRFNKLYERNMTLKEPPRHVKTSHGQVRVLVLPWLQYMSLRIKRKGVKYLFEKTSSGYVRILSLGYYSKTDGEIVIAKVGDYKLRYEHEKGHANGNSHIMIKGDVMHPFGHIRGIYTHSCGFNEESLKGCVDNKDKSEWCKGCLYSIRNTFVENMQEDD